MLKRVSDWLRSSYRRLPVIKELRGLSTSVARLESRLDHLPRHLRLLETAAMLQALEVIAASDERYRDPRRLLVHGAQYWSQNYEDGMIAEIFRRLSTTTKTFLEIGVGDGSENNTTALLAQGWHGWWIDGDSRACAAIRDRLRGMPSIAGRLRLCVAYVSPANIGELLRQLDIPTEIDLFSLDIDLATYDVWAALRPFRPRVVVAEYNAAFPPDLSWVHAWESCQTWDSTQAFGASLKAFELLGRDFGYSLVGCDVVGVNAFFVRDDIRGEHFLAPFTAENHYEPPRYGLLYRWGHASRFFGESTAVT